MRISTSMMYDLGVGSIQQQSAALTKTSQQVATGRRILTPADDPVAAARVLEVSQSKALNTQYDVNTDSATSALGMEETALASVGNLIQDVRTIAINAGNPTLDHSNLATLATDLRGRYQELLGIANSTDGNGQYMFSGYQGATKPFTETVPGPVVTYNGDQGQRLMQISPSRQLAVSDAGSDVFMQIKNGNGTFVTAAAATNTGTGIIDPGTVTGTYDGNSYQISFTSATNYDIYQLDAAGNPTGLPVSSGTYISGTAIPVGGGGKVEITGTPAINDKFTVKPSTNESIFTTLDNLITALETANVPGNRTALTNNLNTALSNFDNGLDRVLTVRASVGARMKENDSVKSTGQDVALQYDQTLSTLQDLDYAKALSDLEQQTVILEAAQKSFVKTQGLSLFNYI
jgi:flagellar hook-associated protein 3 FlgL